eukprot:9688978-Ditylum_brightwellii.AAC.1
MELVCCEKGQKRDEGDLMFVRLLSDEILEQSWWETALVYPVVFFAYTWCCWAGPIGKPC